jgi:quercetin dioxygenase-like cupin family protein
MRYIIKFSPLFLAIVIVACNGKQLQTEKVQKTEPLFPKGDKITNNSFSGTAWLQMLVLNDSTYNTSIGNVTFKPRARTNWHKHPGGQILLVTEGKGYYQEKGKPAQRIQKGEVVKIPPDSVHWHGAAPDNELVHIAISLHTDKGGAVWLQPVTDEEYDHLIKTGIKFIHFTD